VSWAGLPPCKPLPLQDPMLPLLLCGGLGCCAPCRWESGPGEPKRSQVRRIERIQNWPAWTKYQQAKE
jgi:hypothetical protein